MPKHQAPRSWRELVCVMCGNRGRSAGAAPPATHVCVCVCAAAVESQASGPPCIIIDARAPAAACCRRRRRPCGEHKPSSAAQWQLCRADHRRAGVRPVGPLLGCCPARPGRCGGLPAAACPRPQRHARDPLYKAAARGSPALASHLLRTHRRRSWPAAAMAGTISAQGQMAKLGGKRPHMAKVRAAPRSCRHAGGTSPGSPRPPAPAPRRASPGGPRGRPSPRRSSVRPPGAHRSRAPRRRPPLGHPARLTRALARRSPLAVSAKLADGARPQASGHLVRPATRFVCAVARSRRTAATLRAAAAKCMCNCLSPPLTRPRAA
jgi:hypothetical protein